MRFVPLHILFYVGGTVCLLLEALLIWEIIR